MIRRKTAVDVIDTRKNKDLSMAYEDVPSVRRVVDHK